MKFVIESRQPLTIDDIEHNDGDAGRNFVVGAPITQLETRGLYVVVSSWDDSTLAAPRHDEIDTMLGHRIKVTIEVLD